MKFSPVITGSPYIVNVPPESSTRMRLIFSLCSRSIASWITRSSRQPISQNEVVPLKK